MYVFIYLFIHLFIYLSIYLFIHSVSQSVSHSFNHSFIFVHLGDFTRFPWSLTNFCTCCRPPRNIEGAFIFISVISLSLLALCVSNGNTPSTVSTCQDKHPLDQWTACKKKFGLVMVWGWH